MSLTLLRKFVTLSILVASTVVSVAAEVSPRKYYGKDISGFYLKHFARSTDLQHKTFKLQGVEYPFLQNIYRGGRPLVSQGNQWINRLTENKIDLVIDLRSESTEQVAEKSKLKELGISYLRLPWSTSSSVMPSQLTLEEQLYVDGVYFNEKKSYKRAEASLRAINRAKEFLSKGKRIYVHCQRGEDRTGYFIGLMRNANEWRPEFRSFGGSDYASLKAIRAELINLVE